MSKLPSLNVLGKDLQPCSREPLAGFYRNGCCDTGIEDLGMHVVCAQMTREFLEFTRDRGNDLSTPRPELGFPGLSAGDRWCLCATRWKEAMEAGVAPPVLLRSTHVNALDVIPIDDLRRHAIDED